MRIGIQDVPAMCEFESLHTVLNTSSYNQYRPAHAYTYSFEPNYNWSSFYAYAPEVRQYFENFAKKYDLLPYVKLNSRVISAR